MKSRAVYQVASVVGVSLVITLVLGIRRKMRVGGIEIESEILTGKYAEQ